MQLNDDVADGGDKIGTADSVVTPRSDAIRASDTIVSEGHCDEIAETATPYEQTESREENLELRRATRLSRPNRNSDYVYF